MPEMWEKPQAESDYGHDMSIRYEHDIPEGGHPYGVQPRIYFDGRLIAVVGNAEPDRQDEWERDARILVDGANAVLDASDPGTTKENENG